MESTRFNKTVIITGESDSALACFLYELAGGSIDLTGKIPPNYIDALKRIGVEAYNHGGA